MSEQKITNPELNKAISDIMEDTITIRERNIDPLTWLAKWIKDHDIPLTLMSWNLIDPILTVLGFTD